MNDQTFGRAVATRAQAGLSNRKVGRRALGRMTVQYMQCSFSKTKNTATYVVKVSGSKADVAALRTTEGSSVARVAASRVHLATVRPPTRGTVRSLTLLLQLILW